MRTILAVIFLFLFLLAELPILGVEWILGKFNKYNSDLRSLRCVQWAFRVILFLSGVKVTVIGEENVPKDEPVLYIGNHRSFFDIVITYARCPGLTGYVAKQSITKVPILGMVMRRLYCLFMDREDMKQSMKVILTAIDQVKHGISICIFPEGTRNKDTEDTTSLLPFKEGSFKIAQKTGCKIVPMALTGTSEILEDHFPWIHRTHVILQYGAPIDIKSLDKEDQKKIGAHCQNLVHEMLVEQKTIVR